MQAERADSAVDGDGLESKKHNIFAPLQNSRYGYGCHQHSTQGRVAMTSAKHAESRQFVPGWVPLDFVMLRWWGPS